MTRPKTIEQKLAEWDRAYRTVAEALTPRIEARRGDDARAARTAAIVAAMLAGQNIKPIVLTEEDDDA